MALRAYEPLLANPGEGLLGGVLLGLLLRPTASDADLLAVDRRRSREDPVVRRALRLDDGIGDTASVPRQELLQLGLVVDVARERVVDAPLEGLDDRRF